MKRSALTVALCLVLTSFGSASAADEKPLPGIVSGPTDPAAAGWKLLHEEKFDKDLGVDKAEWQIDPLGKDSPWYVDEFSDDGQYYDILGGDDFKKDMNSMNVMRKRVPIGEDGWLTVELAAQDLDKDGKPDAEPTLAVVDGEGVIDVPAWNTGLVLTSSKPLPKEYRVEYDLKAVDFGGKRNGKWKYDGKYNGHKPTDTCKTNFPWVRKGDFSQGGSEKIDRCAAPWGDTTRENGYYLLSIMDYAKPAPHNNIFIHSHRKVGMDTYSVDAPWGKNYKACNPKTGEVYPYTDSDANGINQIFFDGNSFRDPKFAYNQFVMPTPCGLRVGDDPNATIVSVAELQPELMPGETYKVAIERNKDGYATELTGKFKHSDKVITIRNERPFISDDGHSIWHYNQTPEEYDGSLNQKLTFEGPHGSFSKDMWPKDSAYPDYFIIGDPHLNYYEGSAKIDNLKLYGK